MFQEPHPPDRTWRQKFSDAFRGFKRGIRGQSSFFIHFFVAAAVIMAAFALNATLAEWCLLLLCVTGVLTAEMFNSALESLAKAVTDQPHSDVGNALDIGSAAVLLAALGSSLVGTVILLNRLALLLDWWPTN